MKRCPSCNRTFTDPNLIYCVEDGTPLSTDQPADESTVVSPYRPPAAYVPPGQLHDKRRRVLPWLLGLVAAFGIGAAVLLIFAFLLVPRFTTRVERHTAENNTETTDTTENVDVPPPADKDEALSQLTQVENEWTTANLQGDKKTLARILADDYVGPGPNGGLIGKPEYMNAIERDDSIEKWEFYDLNLQLAGNRATLTGGITYVVDGKDLAYNFTDRFVWRNGRWQATGSDLQRRE